MDAGLVPALNRLVDPATRGDPESPLRWTTESTEKLASELASAGVSFQAHIKPLVRPSGRRSMQFAFDLWSYDDVSACADAILTRLRTGTMRCDGPWPDAHVGVFERWADTGKPR